jgi:Tfp pilus assembly protein PilX
MFNQSMRKRLKDQSGMAMTMVLMIMVVALCIVMPGLAAAGSMAKVNRELESSTVAYYAAKAGIEDACWKYKNSLQPENLTMNNMNVTITQSTLSQNESTVPTASGTITTTVTTYLIQSKAGLPEGGEPKATINAEVMKTVKVTRTAGGTGYPFKYAVATTDGLLWIKNNANVNSVPTNGMADVFSNGELRKDTATGFIYGTGYYTEGTSNCANITKGCEKKTEGVTFQTLDETWYWEQAKLGLAYPTPSNWPDTSMPTTYGDKTYIYDGEKNAIKVAGERDWISMGTVKNPTYLGGAGNISYINGNLQLEKNFVMKGVLWVNGYISIEGLTIIDTDPAKQSYMLAHGAADHGIRLVTNSKIYATKNNLNLMSDQGSITLESGIDGRTVSAPVLLGILYAPNGPIVVNSNSDAITSAILGKSVTLDANVTVNYNTELRDNPPEGFEINITPVKTEISVSTGRFGG